MKKGQEKCVMEIQVVSLDHVPGDNGDFYIKWNFSGTKGVIPNLKCTERTIQCEGSEVIEVVCAEVKLYGTKSTKQNLKLTLVQTVGSQKKTKDIVFGSGIVDLSPFTTIKIKRETNVKMKTEKSDFSFDCHVVIWNKNKYVETVNIPSETVDFGKKVKLVGYKRAESDDEDDENQYFKGTNNVQYESDAPRTLEDMVNDDDSYEQLVVVHYPPCSGPIDLGEVFETLKTMKGDFKQIDNFIRLLKKWWNDNEAHIELNILPMAMEDWRDCLWLIKAVREYQSITFGFEENKKNQCQLQIELILNDLNKRVTKLVRERVGGMLKNLIISTAFDSTKSNFEEGIASAYVSFIGTLYECCCQTNVAFADKFIRQIFHYSIYSIIEEIIKLNNVDGSKGFQLNYFAISVQNEMDKVSVLRKYMDCFVTLIEVSRLLTVPITEDIIKAKDDIFPTITYNLMNKILQTFKEGESNPNKIPKKVFKYLSKQKDEKPTPSRYDLI